MEARLHYSRPLLLLQPQGAASPAPAPAMPGAVPDALSVPAPADALAFLDGNAILILALLVCGLVAALALHVVLQCALRVVTLRACHFAGADTDGAAPQDDPEHSTGEGGAGQAAGTGTHGRKQRQPRRITKLVQALPCLAYSSALELAGSSRSECAICLAAFARGEAVRVLPRCSHGFHARCIDRWLAARPTCPTCRQAPFVETTALLQPDSSSGPVAAVPLVRVVIVGDGVARLVEPDAELVRGP